MATAKELNVIITGSTGMVGEGVLLECLEHPQVKSILVINRRPNGRTHAKLKEIIHPDLFDLSPIESELSGYNACFFCAGVSSIGMNEEDYYKMTYTLTTNVAKTLVKLNPGMTFEYISGASTDSTEAGKLMWARVKGKTENDLMKIPFAHVYNMRPGYMHATPGQKNLLKLYKYLSWLYPVLKLIFPNRVSTMKEMGLGMINTALYGYDKQILEVPDIKASANRVS
ncbi:NAD-dependent epimerase/dehydratase family protein [Mucilaginibacter sp. HMF5004]|uniref:NAD-dependent epimerase/dehydratase family protein n=1 Tax=Mucilaginibacter rivuli TaxID=2857527 RepID=UPI001C5D1343|nr:NAD-dependent epimerase/dehydratase family protein [Mucilaginibacter rivuli]MBW4890764.1 NAD-dependent epimerase/dehydratase family protein [Mucilaginibacter rivuli]